MSKNRSVPCVYLLLKNPDGAYLMARRYNTGYQDGNYNVPSGHIEHDELPVAAVIREAAEEIGITLLAEHVQLVHSMYRQRHDATGSRVDYFFVATKWDGEPINAEPHKCDDICWMLPQDFPPNMTPHVRHAIDCVECGHPTSELNAEFFKHHGLFDL